MSASGRGISRRIWGSLLPAKLSGHCIAQVTEFLEALNQLIIDSELSAIELIGALEIVKAEVLADVLSEAVD
jgi:hypothetical protein